MMKSLYTTAAALALVGGQLLAQVPAPPATIPGTETFEIHSENVGADFRISVSFPLGYDQMADGQFPVLYLPDAYWTFGMATDIARVISADQLIPPMLVVAIGYPGGLGAAVSLRTRDMTLRQSDEVEQFIGQAMESQEMNVGPVNDLRKRTAGIVLLAASHESAYRVTDERPS